MIGRLIDVYSVDNKFETLVLEEVESKKILEVTMEFKDSSSLLGKYISIYSTVTELSNTNFDHEYPKGTIGTK